MINVCQRFVISQVGILIRDEKVLLLEDARYPGFWAIPGGRIDEGEDPQLAFLRELKEEINLDHVEIGSLLDVDIWYSKRAQKPYCAIARLIDSEQEDIQLSSEHLQHKWVTEDELSSIPFLRDCSERMCRKGFEVKRQLS